VTIRKAIYVECDEEGCRRKHVWPDDPQTEARAENDAINEGWAKRTTELRDITKREHFCPEHK
jgi:hypothetical protein